MFKRFRHQSETKKQKSKQLWGRDFNIVENGLDEEQVVSFVNDLLRQHEASTSAPSLSPPKTAVTEAEEEAARIIAQANKEAEEIKRRAETAPEEEAETRQKALLSLPRVREKIEEPAQPQAEVTVSEPVEVTTEEPLERRLPKERPDKKETKPDLPRQDAQTVYTDEVELAVAAPVDLKMMSKLYESLQTIPELRILHTSGTLSQGTTVTVVLERPVSLIGVLSSKIPGLEATPELPGKSSSVREKSSLLQEKEQRGVKRIKLALKEGNASSRG